MTPYNKIIKNSVPKIFTAIPIGMLCSNFVKYGQQGIGEIVHILPDKKKQILPGCPAVATARIAPKIC